MRLKWFLLAAPLLLTLILVQSYFWAPTYEAQTAGNPKRLEKFITASIGDAKILNPILHADSASGEITGLVFEGLLDLDEDLNLRGRLAESWTISETAYLAVNPNARLPDGSTPTGPTLLARLRAAQRDGRLPAEIRFELLPPAIEERRVAVQDETGKSHELRVRLMRPARVALHLPRVDQDLYAKLEPILGADYGRGAPYWQWVQVIEGDEELATPDRLVEWAPVFEHNPVILFKLRPGVRFHDGHLVDAWDVKFTYQAIMDPKNLSPRRSDFEPIKAVEVVDPHTVRVVYKRLFSPAINAWTMGILPEHLLNAKALRAEMDRRGLSAEARKRFGLRDSEFNRHPVGAGPFRFVSWQSDELIHLRRFEDYWEGAPLYRDYFYRVVPDLLTQEVEFRTGAVDRYTPLPHQIARYKQDRRYRAFSSVGFGYTYIGYNLRNPLFQDRRVRRALGMAIDVDEIIRYVLYGEGERITGPYPKNTRWYDPEVPPLPYDPEAAGRLLAEAGWKKNADGWLEKNGRVFEFNLITNNGNPIRKAVLTIAQNAWRKLGIKCNTQLFEWAVFLKDFINPGRFDAVVLGWSMGVDPDLFQIWHSSQTHPNQLNFVGYRNPEADRLIVRIRREYDPAQQERLAHALHRVIAADQPYTFLYARRVTEVLDRKIVMVGPDGRYQPIRPTQTGNIYFYFNRWTKLAADPGF